MNPLHIQSRYFSNCCFWAAFPLKENLSYLQLLGALGHEPHFFSRSGGLGASVCCRSQGVCCEIRGTVSPSPGGLQNLDAIPPPTVGAAGQGLGRA